MMLYSKNFSSNKATFLRNDNKIKYTIFPVLFHFYCVVKSLNNILFAVFTPYKKEILLRNMVYFISPSFLSFCHTIGQIHRNRLFEGRLLSLWQAVLFSKDISTIGLPTATQRR